MKHSITIILMIVLCASPLVSKPEPGDTWTELPDGLGGRFVLRGVSALRVSIESGWARDGQIPVVLSFGSLEVRRMVDAADLDTAGAVEADVGRVLAEDESLAFVTYEHNRLRTRMMLSADSRPLHMEIERETGRVAFFIGSRPLETGRIRAACKEVAPGGELYEITFTGSHVRIHGERFVFDPARGIIYALPRWADRDEPIHDGFGKDKRDWLVWAIKTVDRQEKPIDRER